MKFQSTHSLRSATGVVIQWEAGIIVSIHALLAECDGQGEPKAGVAECFNPRTPCGVRLREKIILYQVFTFQSTHSLRSATRNR